MIKKLSVIIPFVFSLFVTSTVFAQPLDKTPFLMGYWSNWSIYATSSAVPGESYPIPGSSDGQNADLTAKLEKINAITYDFLEVTPDGTVYFNDPWSDLRKQTSFTHYEQMFGKDGVCTVDSKICSAVQTPDPYAHGNFQAFLALQNSHKTLKKFISIGGYGHDDAFHNAFANPDRFVNTVATLVNSTGLDGVDLDFEQPAMDHDAATKYASLIKQLREKLGQDKVITLAVMAGPQWLQAVGQDNWKVINDNVNYVDLMTYDFHGGFDKAGAGKTGYISSLYANPDSPYAPDFSIDESVNILKDLGIPAEKIVLGIPAYGRALAGVPAGDAHGQFQPFQMVAKGDLDDPSCVTDPTSSQACSGSFEYKYIMKNMLGHGVNDYQDDQAHGTWAYASSWVEPKTSTTYGNGLYISYVNTNQAKAEAQYIKDHQLGGMMMWELRGDVTPGQPGSLWDSIDEVLLD